MHTWLEIWAMILFVAMLCRRYPNIKFHILADESYRRKFQCLKNCRVYSESGFLAQKINKLLQKAEFPEDSGN